MFTGLSSLRGCIGVVVFFLCLGDLVAPRWVNASKTLPTTRKAIAKKASYYKRLHKAMGEELQRIWRFVQKKKKPKPYFLRFALHLHEKVGVTAKDGVIFSASDSRKSPKASLDIQFRVGSHALDNTGKDGFDWKISRHHLPIAARLPDKFNEKLFKKRIWQLADIRFKEAMAQYHRKRYIRSLKVRIKDKSGDFSKEKPVKFIRVPGKLSFAFKEWKSRLKKVSALSKGLRGLVSSGISVKATRFVFLMVSSDGFSVIKHKTIYQFSLFLSYLSPKKLYLNGSEVGYFDEEKKLPSVKSLSELLKKNYHLLVAKGKAPQGVPVEAPAILMPGVSGVLFHEALGHRLEGQRMLNESDGRTFRRKIGKKVIPRFLSVMDVPGLKHWNGAPLNGHYRIDEQGIPGKKVILIQRGVLKSFLMSRKPLDKIKHSNGHGRASFGRAPFSRQGNLLITSRLSYSFAKLRKMLIAEAKRQKKRYAFIIAGSSGGYTHTGADEIQSFKNQPRAVYQIDVKTGKQKLVRGLEIIGTPLTVINNIIATGKKAGVFNGFCGAESGWVPVSAIAPTLLLKTIELQRVQSVEKKDLLLPSPFKKGKKLRSTSKKTVKPKKIN